jgi:hypothetical protein
VKRERFVELVGRLLDDELAVGEGDELAAALRAAPELRRELRQHLVIWELWSQQRSPERSAEVFFVALQTRRRAEFDGESFLAGLKRRMARDPEAIPARGAGISGWLARLGRASRRPASLGWAALAVLVGSAVILWLVAPQRANAATIVRGEALCRACVLHEGHTHTRTVRALVNGVAQYYDLEGVHSGFELQSYFCGGPAPITVEGRLQPGAAGGGFAVDRLELPPPPPKQSENERILFPF